MKNTSESSAEVDKKESPIEIRVNTRLFQWQNKSICYNDLVKLAYGTIPTDPNLNFSVQYEKGGTHKPSGVLKVDECIKVNHKMIFNVLRCNQS